jgi:hypothetical protein
MCLPMECQPVATNRLVATIGILSAATPSLRRGGKKPAEGGVAGVSTPGLLPEAGRPGLDACRSYFKGLTAPSDPRGPESLFFSYNDVWGAFEGTSVGR